MRPDEAHSSEREPTAGGAPSAPGSASPLADPSAAAARPYASERQAVQAARQFGQKATRLAQRQRILKSLHESGIMAGASVPALLESYRSQEVSGRHEILDFLAHLLDQKADLSESAVAIGGLLSDTNAALRDKVAAVLVRMGARAAAAEVAALGCTRHALREIRLAGVRVLGSIGVAGSPSLLSRLLSLRETTPATDAELREAIAAAIEAAQRKEPASPIAGTLAEGGCRLGLDDPELKARIQRLLGEVAKLGPSSPELLGRICRRLEEVPMRVRLQALFACFSSPEPGVRTVAAEVLEQYRRPGALCQAHRLRLPGRDGPVRQGASRGAARRALAGSAEAQCRRAVVDVRIPALPGRHEGGRSRACANARH